MKNSKKLLFLSVVVCFCMIFFVGCTFNLGYSNKLNHYTPIHKSNTEQYSVIEDEDLEGLTYNEKKQLIAERYIEISFTVIIAEVEETTVNSMTTSSESYTSFGSGFIVHTGGYILTNSHVIDSVKQEPTITTNNGTTIKKYYKIYVSQDGGKTVYEGKLLWENETFDMAILVCEQFEDLGAAVLKDRTIFCDEEEKINVLEEVITVGTQTGLEYYATATSGEITSNLLRLASSDGNLYEHLIQHDAVINHGSSGGALVDLEGNVIGLNTLGDDSANSMFFAVSIFPAIAILDKVVENYEDYKDVTKEIQFGFMGTDADHIYHSYSEIDFSDEGVYVVEVNDGCIISGINNRDVIVEINLLIGEETVSFDIKDQNTLLYSRIYLLYATSGNAKVIRNGAVETLSLNLT